MGVRRPSLLQRARGRKKNARGGAGAAGRGNRLPGEYRLAHGGVDVFDERFDEDPYDDEQYDDFKYHFEAPERVEDPRRRELRKIVRSKRASTADVVRARICSRRYDMNMHLADDGAESDDEDDYYHEYDDEEEAELFQPVY
ncbi:Hypothetical Protein FCC1311_067012 [Hondaea fermentalgiana]|uniref:Uncharacterized protein n=1 Tax=Hondaea fermentalgiana TaxID=2315210 RepID=A0A2R5GHX1_9STRA|nr:Hypothetical Protein FCC1311_067012 [Hondaea fermentalgiana]|eukprot:GBG30482.1 Hypothetical Protein FCC1311_067012 [Hondaea fermentalgiana]